MPRSVRTCRCTNSGPKSASLPGMKLAVGEQFAVRDEPGKRCLVMPKPWLPTISGKVLVRWRLSARPGGPEEATGTGRASSGS